MSDIPSVGRSDEASWKKISGQTSPRSGIIFRMLINNGDSGLDTRNKGGRLRYSLARIIRARE
jgi:hypothetical protein